MDKDNQQQELLLNRLFNAGFISVYSDKVVKTRNYTQEQTKELFAHLSAPIVREYLTELSHNIIWDLLKLRFERVDDQMKLTARYNRASGAVEVLDTIISIGKTK